MKRGDVYWADLGIGHGHRPVVLVSRTSAMKVRTRVIVIPVTSRIRDIRSEVNLGRPEGLSRESVANCDELSTIPKHVLGRRIGALDPWKLAELNVALRFALGMIR